MATTLTWNSLHVDCPRECDVDIEPETSARPDLLRPACPGEECPVVIAMDGHIENRWVVIEYLLGTVAMVNVLWSEQAGEHQS